MFDESLWVWYVQIQHTRERKEIKKINKVEKTSHTKTKTRDGKKRN